MTCMGLQAMATPEMVSYFGEQLSEQVSRGVRNSVTDVRLVSGDLSQAWTEQGRDYATVAMRFSMIDVTRDASGRVVDGSPTEHVTATELWTFVRSRGGHGSCRRSSRPGKQADPFRSVPERLRFSMAAGQSVDSRISKIMHWAGAAVQFG